MPQPHPSAEPTAVLDLRPGGAVAASAGLTVEIMDHRGIVLLSVSGELTSLEANLLRRAVDTVLGGYPRNVQLGLAGVSFMDSGGAQALVRVRDRMCIAGVPMQLLGPSTQVRRVLDVTGLGGVFDVVE